MSERDPLEFLSDAIDRPEQPDPTFAANLLDQLLDDLDKVGPDDAVPLRLEAHGRSAHDDATRVGSGDAPPAQLIGLEPVSPERASKLRGWVVGAAAAVLLVVGGLVLLRQDDQGSSVDTADPVAEPIDMTLQIAEEFMAARAVHDGVTMRSLVADDATIVDDYGIAVPDDYLRRAEFERLTNTRISDISCRSMTPERASCLFSYQNDIGQHLRSKPYAVEMVVTVSDGRIIVLQSAWAGLTFGEDISFFVDWLGQNHPEDLATVVDESTSDKRFTPESAMVIAARSPEFVATTPPSLRKLVADDPRFTTLAEGLDRTGVGDGLAVCTFSSVTLFAPTNEAFDRYFASAGLDRDAVLADVAFFENLVVNDAPDLTGAAGLGEQSIDVETTSGTTITLVGGETPSVQGVPILTDALDLEACNGALNGIDDIYRPSS